MRKEIQTVSLSKERKGRPNGGKGSSLGHSGPNSQNKKPASLKSRAVDVKFQTKGREGNLDIP